MKRTSLWGAGVLVIALGAFPFTEGQARADDKALEELKARLLDLEKRDRERQDKLEKLETQNKELVEKMKEGPVAGPYRPESKGEDTSAVVRKIVGEYIKERDEKKTADDAKAKAAGGDGAEIGTVLGMATQWMTTPSQQGYGIWFENADKSFRFHLGGWADADYVAVNGPARMETPLASQGIGNFDDGFNFRRIRLRTEGTVYDQFDFLMEFDYSLAQRVAMPGNTVTVTQNAKGVVTSATIANASGTVADRSNQIGIVVPTDLWAQARGTPIGNIRIGNVKPMYSMEQLQSSRFIDWMEFSFIWDAFLEQGNNGWIPSIAVWGNFGDLNGVDNRWFYGASVGLSNNKDLYVFNQGSGELEETARIGCTIWDENDGRNLLNVSVGSMHQTANDGTLRYRARFELRNGNNLEQPTLAQISGGLSDAFLLQPELFYNYGSFNLTAEWAYLAVAQNSGSTFSAVGNQTSGLPKGGRGELYYDGGYVSIGYFLTGESRPFDRTWKVLDRVVPIENAFSFKDGIGNWNFGRGAWQVLARWDYLNMDSKGVNGGILNGASVGLNWYLNPNMRLMWNVVADHRDATTYASGVPATPSNSTSGWLYGVGTRLHFDF